MVWLLMMTLVVAYLMWAGIETPCRKGMLQRLQRLKRLKRRSTSTPAMDAAKAAFVHVREPHWLFHASRVAILRSAMVLALLLAPAFYLVATTPGVHFISKTEAAAAVQNLPESVRDVNFGDLVVMRGAQVRSSNNETRLLVVWESLRRQKLTRHVAVHLIDDAGEIIGQADHPQSGSATIVKPGDIWLENTPLPMEKLAEAATVAIGLLEPKSNGQWLVADKGRRDWGNPALDSTQPISTSKGSTGFGA